MKINKKNIVVTGGSKGLGLALVEAFAKRDNNVIAIGRSSGKGKTKLNNVLKLRADVTEEKEIKNAFKIIIKTFGSVDIWINNAGLWMPHANIEDVNQKKFHQLVEVNLFGTVHGSKYALIQMKKQKFGTIINILSSSALKGNSGSSAYCSSKHAALGFTQCLREEAKVFGINVVSVYTRGIKTELFNEKKPSSYDDFMEKAYVAEKILKNLESKKIIEELKIFK